jgi:hypothetical protein
VVKKTKVTWASIWNRYIEFDVGGVAAIKLFHYLKERGIMYGDIHGRRMLTVFDVEKLRYMLGNILALKTIDDLEGYEASLEDFLEAVIEELRRNSKNHTAYFGVCEDERDPAKGMYYSSVEEVKQAGFEVSQINKIKRVWGRHKLGNMDVPEQVSYVPFICEGIWMHFLEGDTFFEKFLWLLYLKIEGYSCDGRRDYERDLMV